MAESETTKNIILKAITCLTVVVIATILGGMLGTTILLILGLIILGNM